MLTEISNTQGITQEEKTFSYLLYTQNNGTSSAATGQRFDKNVL